MGEVGMAVQKSIQTRVVGITRYMLLLFVRPYNRLFHTDDGCEVSLG